MNKADQKSIVSLLQTSAVAKNERDQKNIAIRDMFEAGFVATEPNGPRQIHSKLLVQAFSQISTMMKFLDFSVDAQNRTVGQKAVVSAGISTICDKGGLDNVMRDKGGVFQNLILYGDGYFTVNENDNEQEKTSVPIVFDVYANSNVVLDNNATKIRGRGGKAVTKAMVYSEFTIDEAKSTFGSLIGDAKGKIPRNNAALDNIEKDESQKNEVDTVEIGYFWDISNKKYIVVAGEQMEELENKSGDAYPFMMNGVAYLPIFNFICQPAAKGVYNHGLGDYIYELALVNQKLLNLGINHAYKGADPITVLNVPQGKSKKFIKNLDQANRMRSQGKDAYAIIEHDPMNPGASAVSSQTINTQSLVNEWQMIFDRLTNELKRWGINVDAIEHGSGITASQIISEEEARSAFVKQIMEYNASETQFMVEVVLDKLKDLSSKNDTPLNTTIKFEDKETGVEGEVEVEDITIGDVIDQLKKHDYYVKVNSRTGVFPTNIMKQAQISRVLPALQPGTPAHTKMLKEFASLNEHNFTIEDFGMAQQGGAPQELEAGAAMSGTDRMAVNPRSSVKEPLM